MIQLGQVEATTRPAIKKLLHKFDECDDLLYPEGLLTVFLWLHVIFIHIDAKDVICLELLGKLLYPRKQSKLCQLVKHIEVCFEF